MNRRAQQLGRLGGQAKSKAKAAAARQNGKKGGAPKKGTQEDELRDDIENQRWWKVTKR